MSLLSGPDTTFTSMESVIANKLGLILHLLIWDVSLLIEPDITYTWIGSVPTTRAGYCIYYSALGYSAGYYIFCDRKCPC